MTSARALRWRTVAASMLALLLQPALAHAVTIELKDVAPDRVERQRKFVEGSLPLPDTPDIARLDERLQTFGGKIGDAVLLRLFKADSELELWMRKGDRFEHFATYPICHWSGTLGPKIKEGDKQTPEGFYTVTRRQLHRIGRHPRSLNLGFPNAFDRSLSRTGSYILVHGACSSVGCFAMTNAVMEEIYKISEGALQKGQEHVPVHVFPFRMTDENFKKYQSNPWIEFWQNLREGHDKFIETRQAPRISVCNGRYEFATPAPGEGSETGPLAVCGATAAAIESLDPYFRTAALQPLLWRQAVSQLSPSQQQAFANRRDFATPRLRTSRVALHRGSARLRAIALAGASPSAISSAKCSLARASCRKHVAMQTHKATRRVRTAQGRR